MDEAGGRNSYRLLRAVEWLSVRLPRPIGIRLGEAALLAQMRRGPGRRAVVAANLAQVLGHPQDSPLVARAVEECFRLYGRYWYETFALRTMPVAEVERRFGIDGREHLDAALEQGRGLVLALPHMGNWDAAGHWLCLQGYRMTAVAELLRPPEVFELFLRHRRALGMSIVPLEGTGKTGPKLVEGLARGEVITLVADRDLTRRGVRVDMFGRERLLPAGPAYLALTTDAPLACAAVYTTDEGWRCRVEPPLAIERTGRMREDVAALTRLIGRRFERFIAAAPADWHMLQPAWEDLPEEATAAPGGDDGAASPSPGGTQSRSSGRADSPLPGDADPTALRASP